MALTIRKAKQYSSHGSGDFAASAFASLGENVIFEVGVMIFNPSNISLGNNVYIGHQSILKAYHKNIMTIGDDCWIGQGCFFHSAGGIKIGRAVGIGPGVKILTSLHKDHDLKIPILFHEINYKRVVIEDGADIGVGAIILPGITVGEGAIIGAGSVVTKDVSAFTVVAGNPARVLRKRGD